MFGSKRLRRIEVVESKKIKDKKQKQKKSPLEKPSSIPQKLASIGLGMTKPIANSKIVKIETMSFSKYVAGCQALGMVLQSFDSYALISLPGGVTGTISIEEISDYYHNIFQETPNKRKLKVLLFESVVVICLDNYFSFLSPLHFQILSESLPYCS